MPASCQGRTGAPPSVAKAPIGPSAEPRGNLRQKSCSLSIFSSRTEEVCGPGPPGRTPGLSTQTVPQFPGTEGRRAAPTTDQHSMPDWTRGRNRCYKRNEPQNTYAKPKKPDTKNHIFYHCVYKKYFRIGKSVKTGGKLLVARGWRRKKSGYKVSFEGTENIRH